MSATIKIDNTFATVTDGTWASEDQALADTLNEMETFAAYHPNVDLAEAQAVVSIMGGKVTDQGLLGSVPDGVLE